ncbi:unnamed protein product [Brassica rapa]|uniref:Knottin scorpion toxin-like domain-containing protein n=3 Tax=Brassica TaxID=3705 RepID=A0A3P6A545_BRACM|nr:unnamed protein product [Brassica napus]CAG7883115.1 unnamed protein product [Brassica rapa]CDY66245.1 BnaA03g57900D [Brassica napus]VDC82343.1 unnamed protein product [Brassica rapa]
MSLFQNILISFVFTIFFVTSNVHGTNNVPDFGVEQKITKCYGPCNQGAAGAAECDGFCRAKNIQSKGTCSSGFCCCVWQIKN